MALARPSTCAAMPPTTRGGYSHDSISTRIRLTVAAGRVTYASIVLLGEHDLHFFGEGTHRRLWEWLGAQPLADGGVRFAVWAPNAKSVRSSATGMDGSTAMRWLRRANRGSGPVWPS